VLLAELSVEDLEATLGDQPFPTHTTRTVRTPDELWEILCRVRDQRYALTDQELEDGLRSVAVPVRNPHGEAEAALNIAAHAGRISVDTMLAEFLPLLREAAGAIEADLAHVFGLRSPNGPHPDRSVRTP